MLQDDELSGKIKNPPVPPRFTECDARPVQDYQEGILGLNVQLWPSFNNETYQETGETCQMLIFQTVLEVKG